MTGSQASHRLQHGAGGCMAKTCSARQPASSQGGASASSRHSGRSRHSGHSRCRRLPAAALVCWPKWMSRWAQRSPSLLRQASILHSCHHCGCCWGHPMSCAGRGARLVHEVMPDSLPPARRTCLLQMMRLLLRWMTTQAASAAWSQWRGRVRPGCWMQTTLGPSPCEPAASLLGEQR